MSEYRVMKVSLMRMQMMSTIIFFLVVCAVQYVYCVDIGSDTVVTRFNTQQVLNNGDRIAGFASISAGFLLNGAAVTGTFDCFFPVAGNVSLAGGLLILNQDLLLNDVSYIKSIGHIQGNGHTLSLSSSSTLIPDLNEDCDLIPVNQVTTAGKINSLDWAASNTNIAIGRDNNIVDVYGFQDPTLTLGGSLNLGNKIRSVRWHPFSNVMAVGSDTKELNILLYSGTSLTELVASTVTLPDKVNAVAWTPDGNYVAAGTTANAQELAVFSFNQTTSVLNTTAVATVNLAPDRDVNQNALDWSQTNEYLAVGVTVNASADELLVYSFDGASLVLNGSVNTGRSVNAVSWLTTSTQFLAVGLGTAVATNSVVIYEHNATAGTLTQRAVAALSAEVLSAQWIPGGDCLLVGTAAFSGQELRLYDFNPDTYALNTVQTFETGQDISDVRWSRNAAYAASGRQDQVLRVLRNNAVRLSTGFRWTDLTVSLKTNTRMHHRTYEFSGDCVINGNGFVLTVDNDAQFLIASDSNLLINNATVRILSSDAISCFDNTATLSLLNTDIVLESDFTFTVGNLAFLHEVNIFGDEKILTYQSTQPCIIDEHTLLFLDREITFSYNPANEDPNLFVFGDSNSALALHEATLHVGPGGVNLTTGQLRILDDAFLSSEVIQNADGTITDGGITFGDGVTAANDFECSIDTGARLQVSQGSLNYKNVSSGALFFHNKNANIRMADNTILRLFTSLTTGQGSVIFGNNTTLLNVAGASLIGSVELEGNLSRRRFSADA